MWCQGDQPYRPPGSQGDRMDQSYPKAGERATVTALALEAAEAGMAVFPLRYKHPAISKDDGGRGYKDASRDRSRITAMFNSAPHTTGYGIATGQRSGVVVVDVDGPEGRKEAERRGLSSGYVVR